MAKKASDGTWLVVVVAVIIVGAVFQFLSTIDPILLGVIVALAALVWWVFFRRPKASSASLPPDTIVPTQAAIREADQYQGLLDRARQEHGPAFGVLTILAHADGTTSKAEFRLILGFLQRQGFRVPANVADLIEIEHVHTNTITLPETFLPHLKKLRESPEAYRRDVLATAEALCASQRTLKRTKSEMLDAIRIVMKM